MRCGLWTIALMLLAGAAAAQTRPTRPTQPVPAGGVVAVKPVRGSQPPSRGILYIPQFAPPGVQVPGGPPASNTPTLIPPSVLGGVR